ncbi:hypothetical protein QOZ80_8AG0616940 [Eleusine coracana subsp. coracana]|nr:hypothetical protein QOZ80_8AG0616940 [Eleusine coracana subsp. coracana]
MNRVAMMFVPAAVLIPLAFLFMSGNAGCPKVPTMTWAQACLESSDTPSLYNMCGEILEHAPDTAEVTVYALVAAMATKESSDTTGAEAESELIHGSPSGDEKAALQRCVYECSTARVLMLRIISDLTNCQFKDTEQEYVHAGAALETCADVLSTKFPGSSVVAMVAADRDKAMVARTLGAIVLSHYKQLEI